jgi:hypothetical protein
MNFLPGKPIEKPVKDQIAIRQKVYGAKEGLSRDAYINYQKKVPWIKLTSGVRIAPGSETANRFGLRDSDGLAKEYELFNFLNKGEPGLPGYRSSGQLGYRPLPGIIDMQIHSHNRFGSLRTAVVKFQCWSKEQLDALEILYMRPGYSVLLQWGHSAYLSNDTTVSSQVTPLDYFKYSTAAKLNDDIQAKKRAYGYSYDAIYGLIKNFSWSLRPDGGYDCQTSIVTTGDIIESYKANLFLSQTEVAEESLKALEEYNAARRQAGLSEFKYPTLKYDTQEAEAFPPELSELKVRFDAFVNTVNRQLQTVDPSYHVVKPGDIASAIFVNGKKGKFWPLANSNTIANLNTKQFAISAVQFDTYTVLEQAIEKITADGTFKLIHKPANVEPFYSVADQPFLYFQQEGGITRQGRPGAFIVFEYPGYTETGLKTEPTEAGEENNNAVSPELDSRFTSKLHYLLTVKFADKYETMMGSPEGEFKDVFKFRSPETDLNNVLDIDSLADSQDLRSAYFRSRYFENGILGGRFVTGTAAKGDGTGEATVNSRAVYIKLGLLLSIFNKYVIRSSKESLFRFRTVPVDAGNFGSRTVEKSPKYFTFNDHLSIDPTVCILPHMVSALEIPQASYQGTDANILDIHLNVDHVLSLLSANIDSRGRMLMLDFFEALFEDIKRVCGGVNELELQFDEESSIFTVVDRRLLEQNATSIYPVLNVYGLDSFVKNVNLVSKLTPKMGSMIAISAQASPFTSTEESTGFAALNKDLNDSVYGEKTDPDKDRVVKESVTSTSILRRELYNEINSIIVGLGLAYKTRTIQPGYMDLFTGHYENFCKFILGFENNAAYNFIIPFELNLTLDGISGIKVMEAFRINNNILPYTYGGKPNAPIAFIVTGVEHTVNRAEWSTNLKTQIFNVEEKVQTREADIKGILEAALTPTPPGALTGKSKYPELEYVQAKSTTLTFAAAKAYLKQKHNAIGVSVFAIMYAEASQSGQAFTAYNNNFGGVQTDAGRWGETADRFIQAQFRAKDSQRERIFASFETPEAFLDFMAVRVSAKGFKGTDGNAWTRLYIDKWWSPVAKATYTAGTATYNNKLSIFNDAKKVYDA